MKYDKIEIPSPQIINPQHLTTLVNSCILEHFEYFYVLVFIQLSIFLLEDDFVVGERI